MTGSALFVDWPLTSMTKRAAELMILLVETKSGGQPLTYDFSVVTEKGVTTSSD